jgi:hypothetical protein
MASHKCEVNTGKLFKVCTWLADNAGTYGQQVAAQHQQTFYYVEAFSGYFQPCTVDLDAAGSNQNPTLVDFAEGGTPSNRWTRTLFTIPPAPPHKLALISRQRRSSVRKLAGNCASVGATAEDIYADVDYTVSTTLRLRVSITVGL